MIQMTLCPNCRTIQRAGSICPLCKCPVRVPRSTKACEPRRQRAG